MAFKKVPKIKRDENGEYPKSREQKIREAKKLPEPLYMIATEAEHKLGDLSRDYSPLSTENLCHVSKEFDDYYVGAWVTGFGFFDVCFPKNTTRRLTQEEIDAFKKTYVQIGSQPPRPLNVK